MPGGKRKARRITWFNPPYSLDVQTNVAGEFLKLLDKHFPPSHPLHSIANRTTVKVSYRCLPNMGSVVAKHNSTVLRNSATNQLKPKENCNCQNRFKKECPMPGKCNTNGVVYQATIASGTSEETYVGLAKNFKKRYRKHKTCLEDEGADGHTSLTNHYWREKTLERTLWLPGIFLEKIIPTLNPVKRGCKLCLREKFTIVLKPELASLNSRQEIFAHCRHLQFELIGRPPD